MQTSVGGRGGTIAGAARTVPLPLRRANAADTWLPVPQDAETVTLRSVLMDRTRHTLWRATWSRSIPPSPPMHPISLRVARRRLDGRGTGSGGLRGLRPDGSLIGPPMPFAIYLGLSDDDMQSIVAYLRTVPAVEGDLPASTYNIPLPPAYGPPAESVAHPTEDVSVEYGAYLA